MSDSFKIIVGNCYAVQVRFLIPSFDAEDREQWLMKFKPSNLARIQ